MSVDLTTAELDRLYEGSKDDHHIIVGSEVRQMVGMIRRAHASNEALKAALRSTGVCMSCVFGAPDTFGCTDCLNTGWDGGAPAGFVRAARNEVLKAALREIAHKRKLDAVAATSMQAIALAALAQEANQ